MRILGSASLALLLAFAALPAWASSKEESAIRTLAAGDPSAILRARPVADDVEGRNARCAAQLARGEQGDAIRCWTAITEDVPNDPAAFENLGMLALRAHKTSIALDRFGRALALDYGDADALAGLAQAEILSDDPASASKHAAAAASAAPQHLGAWLALGTARWMANDAAGAAQAFAKATEVEPHSGLAWGRLAIALAAAGQNDRAAKAMKSAQDWAPEDSTIATWAKSLGTLAHSSAAIAFEPGVGLATAGPKECIKLRRGRTLVIDASGFVWSARGASVARR